MRKFVLAAVVTAFTFGLTLAGEVMFVSYDAASKKLVVKESKKGDDMTYTVSEETKFMMGEKEVPADKAMKRLEKMKKGKFEITGTGGKATEIKFPMGKQKKDNN